VKVREGESKKWKERVTIKFTELETFSFEQTLYISQLWKFCFKDHY